MKETEPEESPSKEGSAASRRQHSETLGPTDTTEIPRLTGATLGRRRKLSE